MTVSVEHISKTPGVCGGKACIAGHRIRVMDIMIWHEMSGMTPAQIVEQYPSITVADVHAAIAYYLDHREEIEADIRRGYEVEEKYRHLYPSQVQAKLDADPELRAKVQADIDANPVLRELNGG
jgi:uncharacterized protein (DUF433 family)